MLNSFKVRFNLWYANNMRVNFHSLGMRQTNSFPAGDASYIDCEKDRDKIVCEKSTPLWN